MKLTEKSKRLGVFVFFDRDSLIDDYVIYSLNSLNEAVDNILFVSNSPLSEEELKKLDKFNLEISIRENKGLDAGAFKYLYDKYGKDYFTQYDELILMNDTFFGPFKPYKDIINEMNNRDIDFWGLTANYDSPDGTKKAVDGYIHSHVQTYFVAYRKTVLESELFNKYWKKYNINKNDSFEKVVNRHESYFSYLLEKEGFKWDTYLKLDHYRSENYKYNYNIYGYSGYSLIKYFDCPFIKRKQFAFNRVDAMYLNDGSDTINAFNYIKENLNYDTNMIIKNITRLYKPYDLYQSLNMNYIVEESKKNNGKKLIFANINDEDAYKLSKSFFEKLIDIDIALYTEDKSLSKKYTDLKYASNLYQHFMSQRSVIKSNYDYVCLLNLTDVFKCFQEVVDSNIIRTLENTINSNEYINGITNIFEDNKMINILFTPESYHNKYILNITGGRKNKLIKTINERLSIKLEKSNLIKSFDGLWIRSSVLDNIEKLDISFEELLSLFEVFDKKDFYGKIFNKNYIINDIMSLEVINNFCLNSKNEKMSFPNRIFYTDNAGFFRQLFRLLVPLKVRKLLKKLLRKE